MAKADLTCDYYGDLELMSGATELEIKKQFRQLALKYHPDRNPGREHEVNAKFQTIQAAHEVLTDPEQRAKYDLGRARGLGGSFPSQTRPASGFARGNPWSNVASDFPPPPRATRSRAQPPPSAGAQRYANNFKPSAYGASSSGQRQAEDDAAEARRKTYEAWSKMRGSERQPKPAQAPGYMPERQRPPQPPGYMPQPGYDGRRSSQPPPPKPQPPPIPKRSGYAPGNAAGDEPAASNTSAYSTHRATRAPTAKQQPYQEPPPRRQPHVDPLNQFREKTGTPLEPRLSTPYASRGGEKTNPFESINLNRSQSTRVPSERPNPFEANINRSQSSRVPAEKTDNFTNPFGSSRSHDRHRSESPIPPSRQPHMASETSFNTSPKRTHSKTTRPSNLGEQPRAKPPIIDLTSSEDESDQDGISGAFGAKPRVYAKSKARRARDTYTPTRASGASKASHETHNHGDQNTGVPKTDPKMYGGPNLSISHSQYFRALRHYYDTAANERKRSASDGQHPFATASSEAYGKKWPNLFPPNLDLSPPNPPSGAQCDGSSMNAFEAEQFNILDQLVKKHDEPSHITTRKLPNTTRPVEPTGEDSLHGTQTACPPADKASTMGEPTLGITSRLPQPAVSNGLGIVVITLPGYQVRYGTAFEKPAMTFDTWDDFYTCMKCDKLIDANVSGTFSFSFQVGDQTFTAHSTPKPFTSSSAENISTSFTPEDWHGKFGAGENYFGNDARPDLSRGSSGSGARGRSPQMPQPQFNTKQAYPTINPETLKQSKSAETVASAAKFSAEEWAQTFKAPIFSGPPHPSPGPSGRAYSRSGVSRRTKTGSSSSKGPNSSRTAGTSATISSDDVSDDPLFMGSRTVPSAEANANIATEPGLTGSPNAMDIDPPLATADARNVNVEPSRPEWRAGGSHDTGFAPTEATTSAQHPRPPPPVPDAPDATELQRESRHSDFATNFDDLKKTEPLHTPATGLSSFVDLTSNLPFASKASSTVPLGKGFNTTELALPLPPRGPSPPAIAPNAPRPSQEAWDSYLASMKAYMAEWDAFNTKMMMHFVARKNQVDQFPAGWLGTIGGRDVAAYLEGVREDEKVREWWDVACQKHARAVEDFVWAREVFKSGLQAVGPRSAAGTAGEKMFGEVV